MKCYLSEDELKRLAIIDDLLVNGSEELNRLIEASDIVDRLKATTTPVTNGPISKLVGGHNSTTSQLYTLQGEVYSLKEDLKKLIKVVNHSYTPQIVTPPYELQELKNKNSIY